MQFRPIILKHNERIDWGSVTHVRIKAETADTEPCKMIMGHLRSRANHEGIALLNDVLKDFPPVRKQLDHLQASRQDLRHMANLRESGENPQDKGLIELGSMEDELAVIEFPDELIDEAIWEGAKTSVTVNRYERNPDARARCLEHWGHDCVVCGFSFEDKYGGRGLGFIHVHHLKPLGEIGEAYLLNPVDDLRPVCPNCHAMIHRFSPAASIDEIKALVNDMRHPAGLS